MSTLKVNTIQDASGTNDLLSYSNGTISGPVVGGRRNLIVNGDMRIAQRGTEVTGFTTGGSSYNTIDRWFQQPSGTTGECTLSQGTGDAPDNFNYYHRVEVTTTDATPSDDAFFSVKQIQEVASVGDALNFKEGATTNPVTVSFWVRSSVTGTFCLSLRVENRIGATTDQTITKEYTINSANTWEYKTLSYPGTTIVDHVGTEGYQARFILLSGANKSNTAVDEWTNTNTWGSSNQTNLFATNGATFDLTGVQLEVGEVATPFEHRSYGEELALCQRYYQKMRALAAYSYFFVGIATSTTNVRCVIPFITEMRANPTFSSNGNFVVVNSGSDTATALASLAGYTNQSLNIDVTVNNATTDATYHLRANNDSTAYLELSAEL